MAESSYLLLSGAIYDGQTIVAAAASYARLVTRVTLRAAGVAPADAGGLQVKLVVGVVDQATYTLPQGSVVAATTVVGGGFTLAAEAVLSAVVVAHGTTNDVAVWYEATAVLPAGTADTWYIPTAADIQGSISAPEYAAFTATLLQTGQVDPIQGILTDTVNAIRDAIRSGGRCNLGSAGTIPGGAAHTLGHVAKWHLFSRVQSVPQFQDKAKDAGDQADTYLKAIRDGEVKFIEPTTVLEYVPSGAYGFEEAFTIDSSTNITSVED